MIGEKKGNTVARWIRTHKYWTSIIVLFIALMLPVVLRHGEVNQQYAFLILLFWLGALVGGIIWSIQAKRKGLTLLTIGPFLAVLVLFAWFSILTTSSYGVAGDIANIVFWGFLALLTVPFLFFGIKRYSKRLEPRTVQRVEKVIMPTKAFHEQASKEEPEVKKAEETTLAKRLPKIYSIAGIVFIVIGILILLWSILLTILTGQNNTLVYLMGATMTGVRFWYYFGQSKPIVTGIVFIVIGILTLLWSITSTIVGEHHVLFYATGAFLTGYGFWHYFWKSKSIRKK